MRFLTQRYAITTYNNYSPANSMKRSLEHQDGFEKASLTNTTGILPDSNYSFMNISDSSAVLWALKPAEEGMDVGGAVARVWNLANTSRVTFVNLEDKIVEAKNITHIETDLSDASFS